MEPVSHEDEISGLIRSLGREQFPHVVELELKSPLAALTRPKILKVEGNSTLYWLEVEGSNHSSRQLGRPGREKVKSTGAPNSCI